MDRLSQANERMRQQSAHRERRLNHSAHSVFYAAVVVIAVVVMLAATYMNHILRDRYRGEVYSNTHQTLSQVHNQLVTNLQSHIQIVRGLPGLFAVDPELSQQQFETAVSHLIGEHTQLRNIAAAPDMVIRYMYPRAGNEAAIGLDYRQAAGQWAAAERARASGDLVLAGPLELKQGGWGLITRVPVFIDQDGQEKFWGLVSAVLDVDDFFAASGLYDLEQLTLGIRGKDGLGEEGEVFFGEPSLFDSPRLSMMLDLPNNGQWQLVAEPPGGWSDMNQGQWQLTALVYVVALAVMFLLMLFVHILLRASLANLKFRNLIESSPIPYLLVNRHQQITYMNQAFTRTYGYQPDEIISLPALWQKTDADDGLVEQFSDWHNKGRVQSQAEAGEIRLQCQNQSHRVALLSFSRLQSSSSDELLLAVYDITVRKAAEEQLRFSSRVFIQAHEGIMITDIDGIILDVNPAFTDITGYTAEAAIGQTPALLRSDRHAQQFFTEMWHAITDNGFWQGELWNRHQKGGLYAVMLTISALRDDSGQLTHYVGLFSDITQTRRQQETLELMAHYDVLTKLPNRALFADRFSEAVDSCERSQTMVGVCFLDLDHFKPVNDKHGHETGDKLLVQVASRLMSRVREGDTISRFGGDEFAILLTDLESRAQCEQLLQRIHRALAEPYHLDELTISISASSGVTLYPGDNADSDTLMRHADQAMYQAKLTGRNTYRFFDSQVNQQAIERHDLLREVRAALLEDALQLFYQPEVNMRTGEVLGMEALVRWQHPEKGLLEPSQFLPMIDGSDVEVLLGNWAVDQVLWQAQQWSQSGLDLLVSVNIASRHLQSANFVTELRAALARYPEVKPERIQLEILESSALGDIQTVGRIIRECHEQLGVSIALDDFGTGYSSLTHLRHLMVNSVKIDQSFVRDMIDDSHDYTIVDGVISLAEAFNRQVIAEGVESRMHGEVLLMMGCDLAQGFGIARPMPAAEVPEWIAAYQPDQKWLATGQQKPDRTLQALKLFQYTHQHWLEKLRESINQTTDPAESWPVLDHKHCHCGHWLQRYLRYQQHDSAFLQTMKALHDQLHHHALQASEALSKDDADSAKAFLPAINQAAEQLDLMIAEAERYV